MNIWFASDHHSNILTFLDEEEQLTRPGFASVEEMNEAMVQGHNDLVKDGDRVYFLGDVALDAKKLSTLLPRMNGSKRLLLGNHDEDVVELKKYFKKIRLWRIFKEEGFVCTHIPLRLEQFRHMCVLNVHGHLHQNVIPDPRYFNVSVELHDYKPVHMDEILGRVRLAREATPDLVEGP